MTAYDALPGLNSSTIKALLTSPRAYRYAVTQGREETDAMRRGSAIHCALLEPAEYPRRYHEAAHPGTTKAGKEERAEAADRGLVVLSRSDVAVVRAVVSGVREHDRAPYYLDRIERVEEVIQWTIDGRACKGRIDAWCANSVLLGVKTTRSLARFAWQATDLHYPLQWAWYHDGLDALGRRPSLVVEIVVETSPPYDCICHVIPDAVLELGRSHYQTALRLLGECEARDQWPGAYPGETMLTLPDRAYYEAHPDEETLADD